MSERITEERLRGLIRAADAHEPPDDVRVSGSMPIFTSTVRDLVAEVRRLRGLIAAVAFNGATSPLPPEDHYGCVFCKDNHSRDCPWPPLAAEAEAIRADNPLAGVPIYYGTHHPPAVEIPSEDCPACGSRSRIDKIHIGGRESRCADCGEPLPALR